MGLDVGRVGQVGRVLRGGTRPKFATYEDFQAHIVLLATDGVIGWADEIVLFNTTPRRWRTTSGAFAGPLFGSPFGSYYAASSGGANKVARVIQHALPNGDLSGASNGRDIYFETTRQATNPAGLSKTVNGFTSTALNANAAPSSTVTQIIWWDGARAMTCNPFLMSAPTPYRF